MIKADLKMHDLLTKHPKAKKVLEKYGMLCLGCKGSENETLRHAAVNHGVHLQTLIDELKSAVK